MVLLNDFRKTYELLSKEINLAFKQIGESGWLILGKEVQAFEEHMCGMLEAQYSIGCASGLDALELSLRVLNIQPGDKILTTPLSAFATTLAILKVGAIPVFVDVDETGLVDLELCNQVLRSSSEIKCFIPVHLFGHPLDLKKLREIKNNYQVPIIEDCAQAILANFDREIIGSVGDLAAYSLYPTKNLGCFGDGGFVTTNIKEHADKIYSLRDYGQTEKYHHTFIGMNSRLDELQAGLLNHAILPQLNNFTTRRKEIAKYYLENIKHPLIQLPERPKGSNSVWHLFPILIDKRNELQNYLNDHQIQSGIHYPKLITDQIALQEYSNGFEIIGGLHNAYAFANKELSLPIHPLLTEEDIQKVVFTVNQWNTY